MRIGVMGGTFDPIHRAHLRAAQEVRAHLKLDQVLFVPAGQPWLKSDRQISDARHRVAMVHLAIAGRSYFRLSTIEVERAGPTYTVDTITQLRAQAGGNDELFLILGWDNMMELPQWHEPARLIKLCCIVVVPRPGYPEPDLEALAKVLPGIARQVIMLARPEIDVSASEIRERVAQGKSIRRMVPVAVERYIREHKLYLT